jgi:hypothetical protein
MEALIERFWNLHIYKESQFFITKSTKKEMKIDYLLIKTKFNKCIILHHASCVAFSFSY